MIELFEQSIKTLDRHSSKGNQLKWRDGDFWYKADYAGYEGLAEYVVSHLLMHTSLTGGEYVVYEPVEIRYKEATLHGVKSKNFLDDGFELITLEKLYRNFSGKSLYETEWKFQDESDRLQFLIEEVERITGMENFGEHLAKLITIDAIFLNEDRHMHNIAVLKDETGTYRLCPIFDNGATLLSDTRLDYPLDADTYKLIDSVKAKTFSNDFENQLTLVEKFYGRSIDFNFSKKEAEEIIDKADFYTREEKERVKTVVRWQMHKYQYLF